MEFWQHHGYFSGRHRIRSRHKTTTMQWLVAWIILLCVLCFNPVLSSVVEYDCVYSNSTKNCSSICPQSCFYSLLPSSCSMDGQDLVYSNDSRPGSTHSSVEFNGTYIVPDSILAQFSSDQLFDNNNSYTIAFWVKPLDESVSSKVLIQLLFSVMNEEFTVYLQSHWLFITNGTIDGTDSINTTAILSPYQWHHITIVAETNSNSQTDIRTSVNGTLISNATFVMYGIIPEIYLAGYGTSSDSSGLQTGNFMDYSFTGLISDIGIYSRELTQTEIWELPSVNDSLSGAVFLPQCLCIAEVKVNSSDSQFCDNDELRYNTSSHAIEFLTDNELATYWESNPQESYISINLGLPEETSLSKVFVDYLNDTFKTITLRYFANFTWIDLKYFARNCTESFNVPAEETVSSITQAVCEEIDDSMKTLAFYVVANGRNISYTSDNLKTVYTSSMIQLILSTSQDQLIQIQRVQVCSDFDSNLNDVPSCLATTETSTSTPVLETSTESGIFSTTGIVELFSSLPSPSFSESSSLALSTEFASSSTSSEILAPFSSIFTESLQIASTPLATVATSFSEVSSSFSTSTFVEESETISLIESSSSTIEEGASSIFLTIVPFTSTSAFIGSSFSVFSIFPSPLASESEIIFALTTSSVPELESSFASITIFESLELSSSSAFEALETSSIEGISSLIQESASQISITPITSSEFIEPSSTEEPTLLTTEVFVVSSSEVPEFSSSTFELTTSLTSEITVGIPVTSEIISTEEFLLTTISSLELESTLSLEISSSQEEESSLEITSLFMTPFVSEIITTPTLGVSSFESVSPSPTVITTSFIEEGFTSTLGFEEFSSSLEFTPLPTPVVETSLVSSLVLETSTEIFSESTSPIEFEQTSSIEVGSEEILSSTLVVESTFISSMIASSITSTFEIESTSIEIEESSSILEISSEITPIPETSSPVEIELSSSIETTSFEIELTSFIISSSLFEETSSIVVQTTPIPTSAIPSSIETIIESTSIEIGESISSLFEEITSTLIEITPSLTSPIPSSIETIIESTSIEIGESISSLFEEITSTLIEITPSLTSPIPSSIETIIESTSIEIGESISSLFEEITSTLIEITPSLTSPIPSSIETIIESTSIGIEESISSLFEEITSTLIEITPSPTELITEVSLPTVSSIEIELTSSIEIESSIASLPIEITPSPTELSLVTTEVSLSIETVSSLEIPIELTSSIELESSPIFSTPIEITPSLVTTEVSLPVETVSSFEIELTSSIELESSLIEITPSLTLPSSVVELFSSVVETSTSFEIELSSESQILTTSLFIEPTSTEEMVELSTEISSPSFILPSTPLVSSLIEPLLTTTSFIEPFTTELVEETSTISEVFSFSLISPSSSFEFTSTSIFVTPSTTVTPVFPSVSVTPTVIINGIGILLNDAQLEEVNNETQYDFQFGLFGSIKASSETSGTVKAQLGTFESTMKTSRQRQNLSSITGILSTDTLWTDRPVLTIVLQSHDELHSTEVLSTTISITATHSSGNVSSYTCTIPTNTVSGNCTATITINSKWFIIGNDSIVTFTATNLEGRVFDIGSVTLSAVNELVFNDQLFMELPMTPLFPGTTTSVSIKSSYNFKVFGFNIDCNITGGGSISNPSSPQEFSLLSSYYQDQTNRIALSGFRNRDQFSTTPTNNTEEILVTIDIYVPENDNYSISCSAIGLSLTNREIIVPTTSIQALPVHTVSGDGTISDAILTQSNDIVGVLPYTQYSTFLNIATVNGTTTQLLGPINAIGLYKNGTVMDTIDINCTSGDTNTIKVLSDCSNIYFDGSETSTNDTNISVTYESVYSTLLARVWKLDTKLTLTLKDPFLNLTGSCNNNSYYQSTPVSITGTIVRQDESQTVDVTSLLRHLLTVENNSIATVSGNGHITGISEGYTAVYVHSIGYGRADVIVSNYIASPIYLSIFVFSDMSIALETNTIRLETVLNGTIAILQDFIYPTQPVYINTLLVYEDNSTVEIDMATDDLVLAVNGTNLTSDLYLIDEQHQFPVTLTGSFTQCSTVDGSTSVNVDLASPVRIDVNASSQIIAVQNDLLVYLGYTLDYSTLNITAVYNNTLYDTTVLASSLNITSDIFISNNSVLNVIIDSNNNLLVSPLQYGVAEITVNVGAFNMTGKVTIQVTKSELRLNLRPFPLYDGSDLVSVSSIKRIGDTSLYQQVIADTVIYIFHNGTSEPVNTNHTTISLVSQSVLISNKNVISLKSDEMITENVSEVVTVIVNGETAEATLSIETNSVSVLSVIPVFITQFIGIAGSNEIADCEVTLSDQTVLEHTFNITSGLPLYSSLVTLGTSDSNVASITGNTSIVTLVSTSFFSPISIQCIADNGVNNSQPLTCNTLPSQREVDLGTNTGIPLANVIAGNEFTIPLTLSSNDIRIGVFEIEINYKSNEVSFISAEQGDSWSNGSLVVTEVEEGKLILGGVLNGGVQSTSLDLAGIKFRALTGNSSQQTSFQAMPILLAVANLSLADVTNPTPSTATLFTEISNQNRSKREITEHARFRRQTEMECSTYPVGDINGDCHVDLRDVYYFQEYNLASVHQFNGSTTATVISNNIQTKNITLDIDGDGIIDLDDIVAVEQISSGLVYNLTATYSIVKQFCDCIIEVNVNVTSPSGQPLETDSLHIFVHFAHNNSLFIDEIKSTQFLTGSLEQTVYNQGLYTAIARAHLSSTQTVNTSAIYQIRAAASFTVNEIGMSFIQAVSDANDEITQSRVAGLFGSQPLTEQETSQPFVISFNATSTQSITLTVDNLLPHFILNLTCPANDMSSTLLPPLPIAITTSGTGHFIGGITRTNDSSNLHYSAEVTVLTPNLLSTGTITAEIGNLNMSFTYQSSPSSTVVLRQPAAFLNQASKRLHASVQVLTTELLPSDPQIVNVTIHDSSNTVLTYITCTSDIKSGVCQTMLELTSDLLEMPLLNIIFNSNDTSVSTSVIITQTPTWTITNGIAIVLPPYSIEPDVPFNITVHSNTEYPLISFLIELNFTDSLSIASITSPNQLWGVKCISNRCLGYRTDFQTLSATKTSAIEHLFTATLSLSNNNQPHLSISAVVHELHNVFYQDVTSTNTAVTVVNSTGHYATSANIAVHDNHIEQLYVYTTDSTILNTAVLDGRVISLPLTTLVLYTNGSLLSVGGDEVLPCSMTGGDGALRLSDNCSNVFVDGSESNGADNVNVTVSLGSHSSSLIFSVWYPQRPVKLQLANNVLKAINGAYDTNCSQLYQSTTLAAYTNINNSIDTVYNVDVSNYILPYINVSGNSFSLSVDTRTVQGLTPSNVTLTSTLSPSLIEPTVLTVSNDTVSIQYLYTVILTDINIELENHNSSLYRFSITLDNSFHHINDTGNTETIAIFDDNSTMTVTDLVTVTSTTSHILNSFNSNEFTVLSEGSGIISSEWSNRPHCNLVCIHTDTTAMSIALPTPLKLNITVSPNTTFVAVSQTVSAITSVPVLLRASVMLVYSDGSNLDVTRSINTSHPLSLEEGAFTITSTILKNQTSNITFTYEANGEIVTDYLIIQIVSIDSSGSSLMLRSYPLPDHTINSLKPIGSSQIYQQATVRGIIQFTNGDQFNITDIDSSLYQIVSKQTNINITSLVLKVEQPPQSTTVVDIDLIFDEHNVIATTSVALSTDSIAISSIDWPSISFLEQSDTPIELDVSVNLANNGGYIPSLRNFTGNNFAHLITFSSSNNNIISIDSTTAVLHRNSLCNIQLLASYQSINSATMTTVTLKPPALGLSLSIPTPTTLMISDIFKVSVHFNTGGYTVNSIQASLVFNNSLFEFVNISIYRTDWPGGVQFYDNQAATDDSQLNIVSFGGLALNEGLNGDYVHLVDVYMKVMGSGVSEIYSYVTDIVSYGNTKWENLNASSAVHSSSRIAITVSGSCQSVYGQVHVVSTNCASQTIKLPTDSSLNCPVNIVTSTVGIFNRLMSMSVADFNLDGISNSLDPLYSLQVSFNLLKLLKTYPSFVNSTRDSNGNYCNVSFSTQFTNSYGISASDINVYYIFDITNSSFTSLFNYTNTDLIIHKNSNYTRVILPSIYNEDTTEYTVTLQTSLVYIPSDTVSVSLIQLSGMSPAEILPMIQRDSTRFPPLNVSISNSTVYLARGYTPLVSINDNIVCPLLEEFSPSPSPSPSLFVSSFFSLPIESSVTSLSPSPSLLTSSPLAEFSPSPSLIETSSLSIFSPSPSPSLIETSSLSIFSPSPSPSPLPTVNESSLFATSRNISFRISEMIDNQTYMLNLYSCSLLENDCPMKFTVYNDWTIERTLGSYTVTVHGLSPYTKYKFYIATIDGINISDVFNINTMEEAPSGFTADNIIITSGPVSIEVKWTEPSQLNGKITSATILVSENNSRRRRTVGVPIKIDDYNGGNGTYTVSNLRFATTYTVTVTISNSAGNVFSSISASTSFPSPLIGYSTSSVEGCVNISIEQPYLTAEGPTVSYSIALECYASGITVNTNNVTLDSNRTIDVCYNSTSDAHMLNDIFNCSSNYNVIVNVYSNGFSASNEVIVTNIPIVVPSSSLVPSSTISVLTSSELPSMATTSLEITPTLLLSSLLTESSSTPSTAITSISTVVTTSVQTTTATPSPTIVTTSVQTTTATPSPTIETTVQTTTATPSPTIETTVQTTTVTPSPTIETTSVQTTTVTPSPTIETTVQTTTATPSPTIETTVQTTTATPSPTIETTVQTTTVTPSPTIETTSVQTTTVTPSPTIETTVQTTTATPSPTIETTVQTTTSFTVTTPVYSTTPNITDEIPNTSSNTAAAVVSVIVIIIIVLVAVLVVVVIVIMRYRSKKRGGIDFFRPHSRTSKDFWFEMEETVEMSPIDIVPVDHQYEDGIYIDETIMCSGIIENRGVYSSEDIPSREESLSIHKPHLINPIKPQPRAARTVTFNDNEGPPPYASEEPLKHSRNYEDDNDSLIDLNFSEDVVSQPYLSLGLTPLSQLSPDPLTSNGQSTDLGFFPSMLPPVSPMTSVISATGIPVDGPSNGLDNLVMPDALAYSVPLNDGRKNKMRQQSLKNDFLLNGINSYGSRTLEPLIEQRSLEVDDMSSSISGYSKGLSTNSMQNGTNMNDHSSSSEEDERSKFIFPSATDSPLHKRKLSKGSNEKSTNPPPTAILIDDFDNFFGGSSSTANRQQLQNGSANSRYPSSVKPFLNDDLFDMDSMGNDPRHRKQIARDRAKAEQKAKIQEERRREEEAKKFVKNREIHDSIFKQTGSTVLQNVARFDAEAELNQEETRRTRAILQHSQELANKYPQSLFVSPQHRYSSRPRQPSIDSVEDMKVTDEQVTVL